MSFIVSTPGNILKNKLMALMAGYFLTLTSQAGLANPASDQAFGNCVTAAASYLEMRGHQIGNVTILTRHADQHRMRITPAASDAEPAVIICTASRHTTSIEAVPARLAVTDAAR